MSEQIKSYFQTMNRIHDHLQDEESKILFDARINYLMTGNEADYIQTLRTIYKDWHSQKELDNKMSMNPKGVIIFGAGPCGKLLKQRLPFFVGEGTPVLFCDTYKAGEIVDGKKILSVNEVVQGYGDYLVLIGTDHFGEEVYQELIRNGFDENNILPAKYSLELGMRGKQYFDVFCPRENEIFIDAGCFNGFTSLDFLNWAQEKGRKIYALEPLNDAYNEICKMKIPKTEVFNYAAWNKKEKLYFVEDSTSSRVGENGTVEVQGYDIDSIVTGKATFIKMDIEGSELKALEGARKTIQDYGPRLAISIYHRPEDVLKIPSYILNLVPEYKFWIRHYCSNMCETVLYAEV